MTAMRRELKSPSASTVVALLALFVALGGTGYAAVKLSGKDIEAGTITGKKFKNKTVAGKKLESNTLTGKQIRETRLATVPRARLATSAGTASALTGGAAAGIVRRGKALDTDLVKLQIVGTSAATSPLKTVFRRGPFLFQAACW